MNSRREALILRIGFALFALLWSAWMSRADTPAPAPPAPAAAPAAAETARPNGSLWGKSSRGLAEDVRARRAGDTLMIIVQESATASSTAATKTSRNDTASFGGGTGNLHNLLGSLVNPFGVSGTSSTDGQGQTSRTGSLVTKLSAVIKEVLPNGNLVIEGSRDVGVNAEKQRVVISGTIRPQDVAADNTVSSLALANATIHYDGKGPVGDKQRKGLLTRIFGWLF